MTGLSALIPAAGMGTRLGQGGKAWLELDGRPALVWLTQKLMAVADEVWVAVAPTDRAQAERIARHWDLRLHLIEGGATRQETVWRLVEAAHGQQVLIQDVARPFVTRRLLEQTALAAREHVAAAAFLGADVPVALFEEGWVAGYLPATAVATFQAPQAFDRRALLEVLRQAQTAGRERQSTAQLWLDAGRRIYPVPGEKTNIKLTTPEDWTLAQSLKEYLYR